MNMPDADARQAATTSPDEPVHLRRVDPARGMARWYALSVEMTLFGEIACTRGFGRIGARGGRIMIGLFDSRAAAETELRAILRRKLRRGYEPVSG